MTDDIPEMYLAEAKRRLNTEKLGSALNWAASGIAVMALSRTLQELGWTPPIDEARMAKARKVLVAVREINREYDSAQRIRHNQELWAKDEAAVKAAYDALGDE